MTAAAFDQEVTLLLLDNAVFQLKKKQHVENTGFKDTAAIFKALSIYNVQTLYIESESLQECGLAVDGLSEPVQVVPRNKVSEFIKQFDLVLPG